MIRVRNLTPEERTELREMLTWCQREREPHEPENYKAPRLEEARRRWPKMAELIGFAEAQIDAELFPEHSN